VIARIGFGALNLNLPHALLDPVQRKEAAIPGNTAWLIASPIRLNRRRTRKLPTSAHDIAQDLHGNGAHVTMVQRSPTLVTNVEPAAQLYDGIYYGDGPPLADRDLVNTSVPLPVMKQAHKLLTTSAGLYMTPLSAKLPVSWRDFTPVAMLAPGVGAAVGFRRGGADAERSGWRIAASLRRAAGLRPRPIVAEAEVVG
jgi:hypothetical protein